MKPSSPALKRPATLSDIARLAEVSTMTASRAINESGYVSDEVRRRVMKAANKLGYRPNMLARQLKGRKLNAIGILLPDIANPFASALVNGIKQVCDEQNFTTFIATSDRSVEEEQTSLQSFIDHRVDGLIVATHGTPRSDKVLQKIAQQKVPMVTIGHPVNSPGIDSVTANHYQGAFDAVQHLIKAGHRRIGFLGIAPGEGGSLHRYQGYLAALEEAGIKPLEEYTAGPPESLAFSTQQDGYEALLQLAKMRRPPTAYFARNDYTALGAMHAARTLGLRIPDDIAIAGFDDIPLAAFAAPPLTTVSQPIDAQGRQAASFLLERILNPDLAPRSAMMECRLVVRESSVVQR